MQADGSPPPEASESWSNAKPPLPPSPMLTVPPLPSVQAYQSQCIDSVSFSISRLRAGTASSIWQAQAVSGEVCIVCSCS